MARARSAACAELWREPGRPHMLSPAGPLVGAAAVEQAGKVEQEKQDDRSLMR